MNLVKQIAGAFNAAYYESRSAAPEYNAHDILARHLTPVLSAAFAEHLAENAIVTRKTLGLLKRVGTERKDDMCFIVNYDDGTGRINDGDGEVIASFTSGKTLAAAILALLEPKEKPEPKGKPECCCPTGLMTWTVEISGTPDPTGATLLWEGKKFSIVPEPKD